MTDHKEKARDIMDNACLPEALVEVDRCLRADIETALIEVHNEALEQAAGETESLAKAYRRGVGQGGSIDKLACERALLVVAESTRSLKTEPGQ